MSSGGTPRVNGKLLASYQGRLVRLVGRVVGANSDIVDLEASDGAHIQVRRGPDAAQVEPNQILEVVCTPTSPTNVDETHSFIWSESTGSVSAYHV